MTPKKRSHEKCPWCAAPAARMNDDAYVKYRCGTLANASPVKKRDQSWSCVRHERTKRAHVLQVEQLRSERDRWRELLKDFVRTVLDVQRRVTAATHTACVRAEQVIGLMEADDS